MELASASFKHQAFIPKAHSCEGKDLSPQLSWSDVPKATRSLALSMEDPDAPAGTWIHWILYGLSPDVFSLPEGLPKVAALANGARQGLAWGVESFSRVGYHGPCPPPGTPHRYFFRLYALDKILGLEPKASKPELLKAMEGHVLAQAELIGLYKR